MSRDKTSVSRLHHWYLDKLADYAISQMMQVSYICKCTATLKQCMDNI